MTDTLKPNMGSFVGGNYMTCVLFLALIAMTALVEELPVDWGFLPHLINDILICWGVD